MKARLSVFFLGIGVFLGLSGAAAAAPEECKQVLAAVLGRSFNDRDLYRVAQCAGNVHRLMDRLRAEGVPVERMRVVYLLYEGYIGRDVPVPRQGDLTPTAPRQHLGYAWRSHVVLEVDGQILDLDHSPNPVPVADYFSRMFARSPIHPDGGLENHIRVRVVPGERNLREFEQQGGDDFKVIRVLGNRENNIPELPVQLLRDYLNAPRS